MSPTPVTEALLELADRAATHDGVDPVNEASRRAVAAGSALRVAEVESVDATPIAAAVAPDDAPVELVVDPAHRRRGHGRRLVRILAERGERRFWAHGDLPAARALAARVDGRAVRTLLVLRRDDPEPPTERLVDGVRMRSFVDDDADAVVAVNARAFAGHPEQQGMDRTDFDRRRDSDWFDPEGLFVAVRGAGADERLVGFHWTKVSDGVGEVYVVGVDPDEQGTGLGTALTARGLRHLLLDREVSAVDLYVEGDNAAALAVYRRLGFVEHTRDTLYEIPSDGPD